MKIYKAPNNEIHAYEADGSQDHLISSDYVLVTQEQADQIIAENYTRKLNDRTEEEKKAYCKYQAKKLLAACDWAVLPDVELANKDDYVAYRANLRSLVIAPVVTPSFGVEPTPVWV